MTTLDLSSSLINAPLEVAGLRSALQQDLGMDGLHPQLIVRYGYGPPAPFSLRRPVDDVLIRVV